MIRNCAYKSFTNLKVVQQHRIGLGLILHVKDQDGSNGLSNYSTKRKATYIEGFGKLFGLNKGSSSKKEQQDEIIQLEKELKKEKVKRDELNEFTNRLNNLDLLGIDKSNASTIEQDDKREKQQELESKKKEEQEKKKEEKENDRKERSRNIFTAINSIVSHLIVLYLAYTIVEFYDNKSRPLAFAEVMQRLRNSAVAKELELKLDVKKIMPLLTKQGESLTIDLSKDIWVTTYSNLLDIIESLCINYRRDIQISQATYGRSGPKAEEGPKEYSNSFIASLLLSTLLDFCYDSKEIESFDLERLVRVASSAQVPYITRKPLIQSIADLANLNNDQINVRLVNAGAIQLLEFMVVHRTKDQRDFQHACRILCKSANRLSNQLDHRSIPPNEMRVIERYVKSNPLSDTIFFGHYIPTQDLGKLVAYPIVGSILGFLKNRTLQGGILTGILTLTIPYGLGEFKKRYFDKRKEKNLFKDTLVLYSLYPILQGLRHLTKPIAKNWGSVIISTVLGFSISESFNRERYIPALYFKEPNINNIPVNRKQ